MHFGLWITNTADRPSPLGRYGNSPSAASHRPSKRPRLASSCVTTTGRHSPSCILNGKLCTSLVVSAPLHRQAFCTHIRPARCSCRRPETFASRRNGKMSSALQLDRRLRWSLYAAFALLFATGAAWLLADQLKEFGRWRILASHDRQCAHGPWRGGDADALAARHVISHSHRAGVARVSQSCVGQRSGFPIRGAIAPCGHPIPHLPRQPVLRAFHWHWLNNHVSIPVKLGASSARWCCGDLAWRLS